MKSHLKRIIAPMLATFFLAAGPLWAQDAKGKPAEKGLTPPPKAAPAEKPEKIPDVVAKVNGKKITGKDYQKAYAELLAPMMGQLKGPLPPDHKEKFKAAVVERLIATEVLIQKAEQSKVPVKSSDVDTELENVRKRVGSPENLKKALEAQGMKESDLKEKIRQSLLVKGLIDRDIVSKVTVTSQDAKTYYDSHPDEFKVPERVRARHIIILVPEKSPAKEKEEALAKIKEAQKLVNKGDDFAEVARKFSQDGAAQKGGDLGYFSQGQMVPEFEKVAFSLKPGKVSSIVETKFGYHLIKVEDHQKAGTQGFPEAEKRLMDVLKNQKTQKELQAYVKDLTAKAKIEKTQF
jgi:peptidyl-prolyl cis-trans isomerase C